MFDHQKFYESIAYKRLLEGCYKSLCYSKTNNFLSAIVGISKSP